MEANEMVEKWKPLFKGMTLKIEWLAILQRYETPKGIHPQPREM